VTVSSLVSGGYATPRYGIPGQTDVFGVTPTGVVTATWTTGRGRWSTARLTAPGFAPPGATFATSPRYGVPGQTDAFVTGTNGAVDLLWANGRGTWHTTPISAPGLAPPGAAIATSPQYGVPGQTDAFVTGTNGDVNLLWANGRGTWHTTPISAPGLAPPGAAIGASPRYGVPGQTDAFLTGTNGAVDLLWANGAGAWHSTPISAPSLAPAGAAIATSPRYGAANQTDAFLVGTNGAADLLWANGAGAWHTTPISAPRSAPAGGPIATSPPGGVANRTDVFVKGAHGTLNLYWAPSRGIWHSKRI